MQLGIQNKLHILLPMPTVLTKISYLFVIGASMGEHHGDSQQSAPGCRNNNTGYHHPSGAHFPSHNTDEDLLMDGHVDSHEFDRYLNANKTTGHDLDSNHNYAAAAAAAAAAAHVQSHHFYQQQQQQQQQTAQHIDLTLKSEPGSVNCEYGEFTTTEVNSNSSPHVKTEDDFSLILADVRKTCYNSS